MDWTNLWRKLQRAWVGRKPAGERIHRGKDRGFKHIRHAAIAIYEPRPNQRHLGIIHKNDQEQSTKFLHLGWDLDLSEGEPRDSYIWIDSDIPSRRNKQVAARCRQVFKSNGRFIPYGWSWPENCFDTKDFKHLFDDGSKETGLTCGTFVMCIYDFARIKLIALDTWRARPEEDKAFQQQVIDSLTVPTTTRPIISQARIDSLRKGLGGFRFRPEEVAGAAANCPPPCTFADAVSVSKLVLAKIAQP